MQTTNIETISYTIYKYLIKIHYNLDILSINLISLLLGFFISTSISTIPAQTGDWNLVAAAIIVTFQEIISKIIYEHTLIINTILLCKRIFKHCNSIKIGIIYGLFIDAFKLGS